MIEAVRWAPFVRWFSRLATSRLRSSFAAVHVRGLDELQEASEMFPLLVVANHSTWWDSLVALWLSQTQLQGVQAYGMMDAVHLQRHQFFRWVGGFGVDRTSRRDGARAARYAMSLLQRRGNVVWVFPQGEEQPPHRRVEFALGAAGIARRTPNARVIPVGMSFVFEGDQRPHAYVSVGSPMSVEEGGNRCAQEEAVENERSRIQRQLEGRTEAFKTLMLHRPTTWTTVWLDRVAGWIAPRQAEARATLPAAGHLHDVSSKVTR